MFHLPDWLIQYQHSLKYVTYTSDEDMMKVAIHISHQNIMEKTGGPFGCAIFERVITTATNMAESTTTTTTKLFAVGANSVTAFNNSTLHGEMVAIQLAQSKRQTYSLRNHTNNINTNDRTSNDNYNNVPKEEYYYILVSSCEPCCMCLGGILWSGVHELICGATKHDAEEIGFKEGPVYTPQSYDALTMEAGILVKRAVLQKEAASVLQEYSKTGTIYNC